MNFRLLIFFFFDTTEHLLNVTACAKSNSRRAYQRYEFTIIVDWQTATHKLQTNASSTHKHTRPMSYHLINRGNYTTRVQRGLTQREILLRTLRTKGGKVVSVNLPDMFPPISAALVVVIVPPAKVGNQTMGNNAITPLEWRTKFILTIYSLGVRHTQKGCVHGNMWDRTLHAC